MCKKEAGEQALRWMPSRNQVFTTLPLPIAAPAPVRTTTNNNSSSSTEEAAGDEVVKLKGGNLMEDGVDLGVRQSSHAWSGAFEQQQHQQYQQLTPTIYSCLQEYFRAEELSGISCSACSTAGTLANMQRQLSVAQRKVVRETAASEKPMRDTELPVLALPDNWTSTVIAEAMESLKKLRVVGASDALIQDFDSGFLKIISPLTNKVETIKRSAVGLRRHQEGGTGGSPNSIATPPGGFCSPAVSTQSSSDRELLLLSLKAQAQSEAVKRTALSRLPPLLCLSLCRRVYDESKGKMKKILQHVSFPVILHMDQFCGITGVGVDASAIGRKEAQDQAPAPVSITSILSGSSALQRGRGMRGSAGLSSGFSYKLRAVVEHRGNAETGRRCCCLSVRVLIAPAVLYIAGILFVIALPSCCVGYCKMKHRALRGLLPGGGAAAARVGALLGRKAHQGERGGRVGGAGHSALLRPRPNPVKAGCLSATSNMCCIVCIFLNFLFV